METPRGHPWIEYLSEAECWHLVGLHRVGRVGVVADGMPEIYPVNYAREGEAVVFRTDPGNKLRALAATPEVCFQVDGLDFTHETGWSVLVKGRGAEVAAESVDPAVRAALHLWTLGDRTHWVRITATEVTGRRIGRSDEHEAPGAQM